LFEGGFEVFDDFVSEDIGIGKIVGFFEAFFPEPEDVEAGLVLLRLRSNIKCRGLFRQAGAGWNSA
jgi:hypothetical protein